jgi:hypothetical protein
VGAMQLKLFINSKMDACLLQFVEGSQVGFEVEYDATKFTNPDLNVYTVVNDEKLAINGMPFEGDQAVVNLGFSTDYEGVHGFQFDGLNFLNFTGQVYLKDNYTNSIYEVTSSDTYNFNTSSGTFNDRFELIFTNSVSSANDLVKSPTMVVYPNPVIGDEFVVGVEETTNNMEVVVCDLLGRVVSKSNGSVVKKPTVSGQYVVKVKTPKSTYVKNVVVK